MLQLQISIRNYTYKLLFAIVASRESVPFPIIVEILAMEISFELMRKQV